MLAGHKLDEDTKAQNLQRECSIYNYLLMHTGHDVYTVQDGCFVLWFV